MIKNIFKTVLILSLGTSVLFANMYEIKPIKITENIKCIIGEFNPPTKQNLGLVSNICYVDIGRSIVVIEAGPTYNFAKEFDQFIQNDTGKKISQVIVTNYHDDRYSGASYYKQKNIPIIGHNSIVNDIEQNPQKFKRIPSIVSASVYENTKIVMPDILTDDKYEIKGENTTLEVLKLSAGSNAPSDIVVYSTIDDFIFVGNIVFNGRMVKYAKNSNIDAWIEALEKLEKMDIKYLLGGHGEDYGSDSYKPTLQYLKILKDGVQKAYENDVEAHEAVNYVDSAKFSYYNHYNEIIKGNAQRYFDQLEWAD